MTAIDLDDADADNDATDSTGTVLNASHTSSAPHVATSAAQHRNLARFGQPYDATMRENVRIAYERGDATLSAISRRFGVKARTIKRWIDINGWAKNRLAMKAVAKLTAKQYIDREAAKYASDGADLVKETLSDARAVMASARTIIASTKRPKELSEAVTAWRGAIQERRRALGLDDAADDRPRSLVSVNITGAEHVVAGVPVIEAELLPVPVWGDVSTPAAPAQLPDVPSSA